MRERVPLQFLFPELLFKPGTVEHAPEVAVEVQLPLPEHSCLVVPLGLQEHFAEVRCQRDLSAAVQVLQELGQLISTGPKLKRCVRE